MVAVLLKEIRVKVLHFDHLFVLLQDHVAQRLRGKHFCSEHVFFDHFQHVER